MNADGGYVWLVYGWNGPEWWTLSISDSKGYEAFNCSRKQVESMVRESIALDHYIYARDDNDTVTDLGIVRFLRIFKSINIVSKSPAQFSSLYYNLVKENYAEEILNPSIYGGYQPLFVDALWITALALNATEGTVCENYRFYYDALLFSEIKRR